MHFSANSGPELFVAVVVVLTGHQLHHLEAASIGLFGDDDAKLLQQVHVLPFERVPERIVNSSGGKAFEENLLLVLRSVVQVEHRSAAVVAQEHQSKELTSGLSVEVPPLCSALH